VLRKRAEGVQLAAQQGQAEAEKAYREALAICKKRLGEQHTLTADSYNNLALNLSAQGKHAEATRAWQTALLGHDAGRLARAATGFDRSVWGAGYLSPRQGLVLAHAALKEPVLAWQNAEADLARGLLDDLGDRLAEDAALLRQLKKLEERLLPLVSSSQLDDTHKQLRDDLSEQQRQLRTRLARDLAARSAQRVWSLGRIQKHLPDDAALVLWVSALGENWSCVLRSRGQPRWQRLSGTGPKGLWTDEDYEQPLRLHAALANRRSSATRRRELIEAVRQCWLTPLVKHLEAEGKLPAVRRLFVVPSGMMSALPVEVIAPEWTVSYPS
jgi:hypothetical protein